MARHPAPYPAYVLDRLAMMLRAEQRRRGLVRPLVVLDPMAGIGRVHDLPARVAITFGVEIEPEWANQRIGTTVGDATALPANWTNNFDAVVVSPVYGNRMSDHHEAKDSCKACDGTGVTPTPDGCAEAPMLCPDCSSVACVCGGYALALKRHVAECAACSARRCRTCGGNGLSKRYTYRHALGRPLSENNAGQMQWPSAEYRGLHEAAWREAFRVLRPDGTMLVNVKNHVRNSVEQHVAEWHEATLRSVGFRIVGTHPVPKTRGIRHGANADSRVEFEQIIVARKPKPRPKKERV